jgi:hypothetical protein
VRPAALSKPSSEALPDEPSPRAGPHPNLISLCRGCGTRLSNNINATGSTHPLIWTALTLSRSFGTVRGSCSSVHNAPSMPFMLLGRLL